MKKILVILTVLLIFACIGFVSAEDISLDEVNSTSSDSILLNDSLVENTSHAHSSVSDVVVKKNIVYAPGGNFNDLSSVFSSASSGDTVVFTGNYMNTGQSQIVLSKDINIEGNGHTVDCNHKSKFLAINGNYVININNLTAINGYSYEQGSGYGGGCIGYRTVSGFMNITNCVFLNNYGDGTWGGQGGAIEMQSSNSNANFNLYVSDCYFYNNTVRGGANSNGGSIYAAYGAHLYLYNSTFINCTSIKGNGYSSYGGAVNIWAGRSSIISNNTFINNTAQDLGGAVRLWDMWDIVYLTNNIFLNNFVGNTLNDYWTNYYNLAYNNWFGTSNPDFTDRSYGNIPQTWVVMNFTNVTPFTVGSGSVNLVSSLNWVYNSSSKQYQYLAEGIPTREVSYSVSTGSISNVKSDFVGEDSQTFSYSGYAIVNATIDNQTIMASTSGIESFMELQLLINNVPNGGTLTLTKDYTFNPAHDLPLTAGITIDKEIRIIGNNHTINGLNQSRIFFVTGTNVRLENLTLTGGFATTSQGDGQIRGGAVWSTGTNFTVVNCTFIKNYSEKWGSSINQWNTMAYIQDCIFVNNSGNGITVCINSGAYITGSVFVDNGGTHYNDLWLASGYANYNAFVNDTGSIKRVWMSNSNLEYNWWGNNTPNISNMITGTVPQTYLVMNFTTNTKPTVSGGNIVLTTTLDTLFNSSSNTYTKISNPSPIRTVVYETSSGTINPQTQTFNNTQSSTLNYPSSLNLLNFNSTIDRQTINIGTSDINVNLSVSSNSPQISDVVMFILNITNNGPVIANDVNINFKIPDEFTVITNNQATYNSTTGIWVINNLTINESKILNITALVALNESIIGNNYNITAKANGSYIDFNSVNDESSVYLNITNVTLGSFTMLQRVIDNTPAWGTVNLMFDVAYNPLTDTSLITGMTITKPLTINGNGYTLNGTDKARIFAVTSDNVNISNIIFTNGYGVNGWTCGQIGGSAIGNTGKNVRVTNCTFTKGYSSEVGAAIDSDSKSLIYLANCSFINNTGARWIVDVHGDATAYITGCLFENNTITQNNGYTLWFENGNVTNCAFINNGGKEVYATNGNCNFNNNWWGTNTPNFNTLFNGNSVPKTYVIMNFTNLQAINSTGGTVELLATLDTIYDTSSQTYSKLTENLPPRPIKYTSTSGTSNPNTDSIVNNHTTNFTYSSGLSYLNITATIDNQNVSIETADIQIFLNISKTEAQLTDTINYTITIYNNGPNDARDITVYFKAPSDFTYNGDSGSGFYNNTTGIWSISNLTKNSNKTLSVSVKIPINESLIGNWYKSNATFKGTFADFNNNNDYSNVTMNVTNITTGSFTLLQSFIDATPDGGILDLIFNVTYDPFTDGWLQTGMRLNKSITIRGHGYTLSGLDQARIFLLTGNNVGLFDINFKHGYTPNKWYCNQYCGAAIASTGHNVTVGNCTFSEGYSLEVGAAIDAHSSNSLIYMENCTIYNNTGLHWIIDIHDGAVGYVKNCLFENNTITDTNEYFIWLSESGCLTNCAFANNVINKGYFHPQGNNYNLNNNWYGNNTPNLNTMCYNGLSQPDSYIIMNFTNLQAINSTGGTVELLATLDTVYNASSNTYSKLTGDFPTRKVTYSATTGSFSPNTDNLTYNHTTNFTYSPNLTILNITATIDNETLYIKTSDIEVNITVNDDMPQLIGRFNYTINITNYGPENARDILVHFKIPSDFSYISDNSTGKYNTSSGIWDVGNLTVGQTKTLNIEVRVPFDYSLVNKTYNSTAYATGTYADFNNNNDNDWVNITVQNRTGGSYTVLQYFIDTTPAGGTLNLAFNVTYDPVEDAWLKNGMILNKSITINGNDHTISGLHQARIFTITTDSDITLNNLNLFHGYWGTERNDGGAAIRLYGPTSNLTINYCNFTDNHVEGWGGAIYARSFNNFTVLNSYFYNNTECYGWCSDGGAIMAHSGVNDNDWVGNYFTSYNTTYYDNNIIPPIPSDQRGAAVYLSSVLNNNITYNIFINNTCNVSGADGKGGALHFAGQSNNMQINYNVFVNDYGNMGSEIYSNAIGSPNLEYNWWGNNTPNFNTLLYGINAPETWVIMNFTNTTPITYNGGVATLNVCLNTLYNQTSNTTTPLTQKIPPRTVIFNWTQGTVNPNISNIQGSITSTFTYPVSMGSWIINATIDNQTLSIGSADIEIIIIPNKNPINDGDNITFNITVRNNGPMPATDINLTLYIPYGLINITTETNNGTFNNTTMIWTIGDLNTLENVTLILNGTLADPGYYLLLNASIDTNHFYDDNLTNHNVTCNVTVIRWSDLEITKNVSDLHPDTKENVTYTITVYNHGPSTAVNVTVFDNLSTKLIYQTSNATSGYYNETTCIWLIDNITPGGNETLNITVFINQSGFTDNFVNVSCPNNDSNWTNNYANITFETAPLSDLWVTINMEPQSSNYITYHIQAGNNGIEAANGTVVVFNLSNLYVWFNHTTDKGLYNNDTGVWDIGYLDVNETVNMTLIVRLDFPMGTTFANITTSVNITSWSTDLYPENNTDNVTFEAEIFGNFRLLQDIIDSWPENTTQILPRSFAYDPIQDAKLPGETYDLINGVRLYKNITIINPYGFTLGGFDLARIFNISADNVILDGLRFFDGNSPLGAALNIHADNVQVLRSNFSGNWLFGDYGGAIYTGGKNTLIMDNIFTENSASKLGGAIGAVGATNLRIINNTFINNSVESDEIFGGAVGIINSTAIVNGNVFLDNMATSSTGLGSAIYTNNSNVNLEANWFGNNTPDMITDELIWGVKPETYVVLDWEISNPNMADVTLNAVFFLYNTTTGNKTPLDYGIPYRTLTVSARDPTLSWYNSTFTGNNTFNYIYNPNIPVYQVNATVDYQTITLEWSTFLSVNKTLLNDTIWFGDDLIYNITIINYGPHSSYIVTISDLLPTGLTINDVGVLYGSTSIIGDNVYWTVSINAGSNISLIVNTTPTHEGIFINNVTVNSTSQYDYFLWGNTSVSAEVLPLFDLSINFTISNPPYYVGEEINYTITIHNSGPSNASNVSVYIPIPAGLTFLYAWNLEGYIPNYTTSTGLWNVDTLHVNETIQINMTLRLDSPNWYNQTVNISGYGVEINETDNNQTISFNVTTQVDLELNMTISTNETLYGNLISITYSLLNKGPSPATNTTVFTVFTGLTYSWASGYGSFNNITPFTGYWYVGTLNRNKTVTLTLYFYANNVGNFTVTGRANSSDNDSYYLDNYDNVTLKVIKYADLKITKTVSNSTPYVGQNITYTITVTNLAGFTAENVTVTDYLPNTLIYDNNNPDFNGTHWFIGNLSVGETRNLTFNITVNESGIIWNNVTVNSSLNDSNYNNNHAEVSINSIYKYADLKITKTVSNSTPFLGQTITYTITVTNLAGFDTENVTVYDPLPSVLIYDNSTPEFNGTHWFVGNLTVGQSKNITFNVTIDGIGIIWNNVTVNSSLRDNNPNNNHAEVSISVPVADDLRMYINIIPINPSSNAAFIINLSVWNRGYTDNQNVTVEFHIPTGLIYLNSTNMGAYNPGTGFWDIGFLGNGVWTNLEIWVNPTIVGNITAEANVSGQVPDTVPWNNRANITFEITPSFNLGITKTANTTTIDDGDLIGFDITVWNYGPYQANEVKIIDYLPTGLQYYSNNASGIYDNNTRTVNWTIPTMNMGDNFIIHLTLKSWGPGLSFTNIAKVEAFGSDSNTSDNTATVTVNVTQNNDLEVRINASKTKDIDLGETVIFYITVLNHGPSNATNVIAHFTVPSIFTYLSDNSGGYYIPSTGEWLIGNLGSGNNITLAVTTNLTTLGLCTVNATVNSTYLDKNLTNNYDELNITATPLFDLNITAYWNLTNNTLIWQNLANLTIIVNNIGPENASNVTVNINVPGVSYVNDTSPGNLNTTTWTWNIGNLNVGEYKNITITFKGETCGFYWTTGNITGHGHDNNTDNNNYTLNLSIIPVVDLVMTNLTVNTTYAGIDEILEFNITVYNKGPCNATNVTIVDFLPTNWTIYAGNIVANIPINTSHTFNLLVNASTYGNFTVGFNATINGIDTYPLDNNKTIGPIEIIYHANIMITIKVNNNYPVTGDILVYVITVTNLDWRTAHNVTANVTIPNNLSFNHHYLASGTYNPNNGTWTIGNLSFRNSTSLFLFTRVNTPGNTNFWVNVTSADYDFYPENNNDTINITTTKGLDLNITINTTNNTPYTGNNLTFTITVENIGLINATNVNVDINIPIGFINPTSTDLNFTGNSWNVGNLNIGESKTLNFTIIPITTNISIFNVSVSANRVDYNLSNNFANITISPITASDLQINITTNNTTPRIGENVTYTITIHNNGLTDVDNVIVFNNLPFSLAYATSTPIYSPTGKMWSITNLPAGATETLNITINHTLSGEYTYNVNITGNTIDTNNTNNKDNITITVIEPNDLKVEFTTTNTIITDGNLVNFTITVINDGIYNNTNVKVYTNLPNTVIYNSTEIFDTQKGIWNVGNLAAGENKTITLVINLTDIGNYTYWANGTGDQNDRNYSNNNQSIKLTINADYDLKINITTINTSININDTSILVITVTNYGPSTAYNVTVLNDIPGNLTGISKGTYTGNVWNISNLLSGETQTLNLTIKPALNGTYIYNVEVTADNFQFDRNNTNNKDNITINITNIVDLIINITSNKTIVNKTEIVEFIVTVYNDASITANNVLINTENLFYNVIGISPSTGFVSSNSWLILSLAPNTSETLKVIRTINNDTLVKVNVSSDNQEEDNSSNFANTTVYIVKETDLSINITANDTNIYIGDNITFTITVTNLGNKTAENVTVHLDLPYTVSYDNVYMYDSQQGIWLIGELENKTSISFNVTATINKPGVVVYNATVNTTTIDTNILNNYNNVTINITSILDLEISLSLNITDIIYSTDSFMVFVNVSNYGPSNATGVTVNLNIPGTTYNTNNGTYTSGIWNIGNILTGETVYLNITCNLTSSNNGMYYANVTSNEKDKNASNNNASINLTILDISDLEVKIISSVLETDIHNSLTYTITVTNHGPDSVNDAVVKVDLPSAFNVTFNMSSNGVFNGAHWILSTLGTGFSGIANLYITGSYNSYGNQTTFVSVNSSNQDDNNTNNHDNVGVWITPVTDLVINFTTTGYYNPDGTITFNITVTNFGPCNATNIKVYTNLPESNDYNESTGYFDTLQGIWYISTLNMGQTETLIINTTYISGTQYYANITNSTKELNNTDNIKYLNFTVIPLADLSINITVNNSNPIYGESVTFTITATNRGPYNATGVIVGTDLPASPIYTLSKGLFSTVTGNWSIGNLSVGETATLKIIINATSDLLTNTNITGNVNDTNTSNNNDTINITLKPVADLSIKLTLNQSSFLIGDNITITLNVTNYGPNIAENITINTIIPIGFIPDSAYSWNLTNLTNNTNIEFNITGILTTDGIKQLQANITSLTYDNDTNDNFDSISFNVENTVDLLIEITSNTTSILAGELVNIIVNVTNIGNGTAQNVIVCTNIFNATGDKTGYYDKDTGYWYIGNLTTNETVNLNLTVQIIENTTYLVSVNTTNVDTNSSNNNDTLNISVTPVANLNMTVTTNSEILYLDDEVTYIITVTNNGYNTAENVTVNTNLNTIGFNFTYSNNTNFDDLTGVWTVGNLSKDQSVILTVKYIANITGNITTIFNTTTTTNETQLTDNAANNTIEVLNTTKPVNNLVDLIINISTDNPTLNVNDTVIFNITVFNNGTIAANNLTIHSFLPTGLNPLGTYTGEWNISTLPAYSNISFTFTVNVTNYGSFVTNTSVDCIEWDINPINNRANTLIVCNAPTGDYTDLQINITRTGNLTIDGLIKYIVNVTNNGPALATNVNVTISIFEGLNYISDNSSGSFDFNNSLWNVGNLNPGTSSILEITLNITKNGYYNNAFLVYSNEMDSNPQNNLVLDNFQINDTKIDVSVKISANKTYTNINETIQFTVIVTNHLNPVTDVNITFDIPDEFIILNFQGYNNGSYYIGNMLSGEVINFTFTATLNSTNSSTITVNATLNETDSYIQDNYDTITVTPLNGYGEGIADLHINITVNEQYPEIGTVPIFTVIVTNYGPDNATNVMIPIYVPNDCTSTSFFANTTGVVWDNSTSTVSIPQIAMGESVLMDISFRIDTTDPILFNASTYSDQLDPNITDNKATISLYPWEATPTCDLNITIVPIGSEFYANDIVKFNVTIRNFGEKTAFNVSVRNIIPPGLTLENITTTWAYTPTSDGWFMPNHTINTNKSFILTYKINNKGLYQTTMEVNSTTLDVDPTSNGMGVAIYAGEAEPDRRNVNTKTTGTVAVATLNGNANWTFKGTLKMANTTASPTQNFPGQKLYANITSDSGFELLVESIDITGTNGVANFAVNSAQLMTGAHNYKVTIFYKGEKTSDTYYLPSVATSITRKVTVNP